MKKTKIFNFINEDIAFLLIFTFAVFLYLFNINFCDLWSDEYFSKSLISLSYTDLIKNLKDDLHPPLYFMALKGFTSIFGLSTFTMRLFSVIAVLSTLVLGYYTGQRIFGKKGALYFVLLLISLPMLASYSHEARMYTWAAFSITGVFLFAYLFVVTSKKSDLAFLFLFSLMAMYIHYYSLVAAFVTNLFILIHLLMNKDKKWIWQLISGLALCLLYVPWIFMLTYHVQKVQHFFWAPEINWDVILSCFINPFAEKFWISNTSIFMAVVVYSLTLISIYWNFIKRSDKHRLLLGLSLSIFLLTILFIMVISLFSQPVLYFRYIMAIVTTLMVPPTLFFIYLKNKWVKLILMSVVLFTGLYISFITSHFSFGPYKQSLDYISGTYPDIKKVLHISEITAGPMMEYNDNEFQHFWLESKVSNVDLFHGLKQFKSLNSFLQKGEKFCAVNFHELDLNRENLELAISESELIRIDTVVDNKVEYGLHIVVFVLQYQGKTDSELINIEI